jgi:hypothetical protein
MNSAYKINRDGGMTEAGCIATAPVGALVDRATNTVTNTLNDPVSSSLSLPRDAVRNIRGTADKSLGNVTTAGRRILRSAVPPIGERRDIADEVMLGLPANLSQRELDPDRSRRPVGPVMRITFWPRLPCVLRAKRVLYNHMISAASSPTPMKNPEARKVLRNKMLEHLEAALASVKFYGTGLKCPMDFDEIQATLLLRSR